MGKAEPFWNKIMESADLGDEAGLGQTIVEISGFSRVLIENHEGVRLYERNKILIQAKSGVIQVCGECLLLTKMSREILVIRGNIQHVHLQQGA